MSETETTVSPEEASAAIDDKGSNQLKSLVEKIEGLEAEKMEIQALIRDALLEARVAGYDPKIIRQVLKCRKMKKHEYLEQEQLLGTYLAAVGLLKEAA